MDRKWLKLKAIDSDRSTTTNSEHLFAVSFSLSNLDVVHWQLYKHHAGPSVIKKNSFLE